MTINVLGNATKAPPKMARLVLRKVARQEAVRRRGRSPERAAATPTRTRTG